MSELSPQPDQRKLHLPKRQRLTIDEQTTAKIGANKLHIAVEVYTLDDFTSHEDDIKEYFKRKYGENEWTSHVVEIDNVKYVFFVSTEKGQAHMLEQIKPLIKEAEIRTGFGPSSPDRSVGGAAVTLAVSPLSYPEQQPDPRVLRAYDTTPKVQPEVDIKA